MSIKKIQKSELSEYTGRVRFYINELAKGKQNRFAKMVGKSKSTISAVLSGLQRLGADATAELAKIGCNTYWLESGEGEPYLTKINVNQEDLPQTQADRVRYHREKKGWDQIELAEKLGLKTAAAISQWERGKRTIPTNHLIQMSKLFDVEEEYMLRRDPKLIKDAIQGIDKATTINELISATQQVFSEQKAQQDSLDLIAIIKEKNQYIEQLLETISDLRADKTRLLLEIDQLKKEITLPEKKHSNG